MSGFEELLDDDQFTEVELKLEVDVDNIDKKLLSTIKPKDRLIFENFLKFIKERSKEEQNRLLRNLLLNSLKKSNIDIIDITNSEDESEIIFDSDDEMNWSWIEDEEQDIQNNLNILAARYSGFNRLHLVNFYNNIYSQSLLTFYDPYIYQGPFIEAMEQWNKPENEYDDVEVWFKRLPSILKVSYYFLLSDKEFPLDTFKKWYIGFLENIGVDDSVQYFNQFTEETSSMYLQSSSIAIKNPVLIEFLINTYTDFRSSIKAEVSLTSSMILNPVKLDLSLEYNILKILNLLNKEDIVFTTKGTLYKRICDKLDDSYKDLLPSRFGRSERMVFVEYNLFIGLICNFFEINKDRSISLMEPYIDFALSTKTEQVNIIRDNFIEFLTGIEELEYRNRFGERIKISNNHATILNYILNTLFASTNNTQGMVINRHEVIFDIFKRNLEAEIHPKGILEEFNVPIDYEPITVSSDEYRPQIKKFDVYSSNVYTVLFDYLQFFLPYIGFLTPHQDNEGIIQLFKFNDEGIQTSN